jgi:WD40 repeat protein
VAVSPDGERIVAGGWDATLRVWDRETGSLALVLRGHGKRIDGVAFSADGRRIVSASLDGTVRLWDALE